MDSHDYGELRAYLQRGETRLSTAHRVAGSFISGAGLLTLLPLLVSGTFSGLLVLVVFYGDPLLPEPASLQRWAALAPVLASITLPLLALYLLIRDLILFYFTARTFSQREGGTLLPRFILSGIRVSDSSLSDDALRSLEAARDLPYVRELLVPSTAKIRKRLLAEGHLSNEIPYSVTTNETPQWADRLLRDFILHQTGSDIRTLPEEAAKMEASIARHHRFLRGIVLRYAKAFLLTILTTVSTIAANGVLSLLRPIDGQQLNSVNAQYVWLSTLTIYALWALAAVFVVKQPIEWLYADSGDQKEKKTPPSLLGFEQATLVAGMLSAVVVGVDVIMFLADRDLSGVWPVVMAGVALMSVASCVIYGFLALRAEPRSIFLAADRRRA